MSVRVLSVKERDTRERVEYGLGRCRRVKLVSFKQRVKRKLWSRELERDGETLKSDGVA